MSENTSPNKAPKQPYHPTKNTIDRIEAKLQPAPPSTCLLWTAGLRHRSPSTKVNRHNINPARVLWAYYRGPTDKPIGRKCGNGMCCNIDHLTDNRLEVDRHHFSKAAQTTPSTHSKCPALVSDSTYSKLIQRVLPNESGCLEWQKRLSEGGYGIFKVWVPTTQKRQNRKAHRLVWAYHNGDPGNLLVRHLCHNRKCCNIDHLAIGTQADNYLDNLSPDGSSPYTVEDIRCIRRRASLGESMDSIAFSYGVSVTSISGVVNRRCYSGVE